MTRTLLLGAALAFGLATAANAGIAPAPVGKTESLMSKVAEGCGRGFWRGPNGRCHPMFDGRGVPARLPSGPGAQALLAQRVRVLRRRSNGAAGPTGSAAFILWTRREGLPRKRAGTGNRVAACSSGSLAR
jgi:hypothetical protein